MSNSEILFVALDKKTIEVIDNALWNLEEDSWQFEDPLSDDFHVTRKRFIALMQLLADSDKGEKTKQKDIDFAGALIKVNNIWVIDWKQSSDPFHSMLGKIKDTIKRTPRKKKTEIE